MPSIYRQRMNNVHKCCQVIWGEFDHLTTKKDRWNLLKSKQIQNVTVMPTWTTAARPAGRLARHLENIRWLRSTARSTAGYFKKKILNYRSTGHTNRPVSYTHLTLPTIYSV